MRVWVSHWFSTAYHLIESFKECGAYVIATNYRDTSVYKTNADEFYLEEEITNPEEYLAFCLGFCKEHSIDLFFPRKHLQSLSHFSHRQ